MNFRIISESSVLLTTFDLLWFHHPVWCFSELFVTANTLLPFWHKTHNWNYLCKYLIDNIWHGSILSNRCKCFWTHLSSYLFFIWFFLKNNSCVNFLLVCLTTHNWHYLCKFLIDNICRGSVLSNRWNCFWTDSNSHLFLFGFIEGQYLCELSACLKVNWVLLYQVPCDCDLLFNNSQIFWYMIWAWDLFIIFYEVF